MGVSNSVVIKPALSATVVKADIEAAQLRRAVNDAKTVIVGVQKASVTPTAAAHNWAERELVNRFAWGSSGVGKVIEKTTLVY